jgi:hypothetical protein
MDGQTNGAQQAPGVAVDTGPTPLDVLEARMTLQERELMNRMEQMRVQLAQAAANEPPHRITHLAQSLELLNARLDLVRSLRSDW